MLVTARRDQACQHAETLEFGDSASIKIALFTGGLPIELHQSSLRRQVDLVPAS